MSQATDFEAPGTAQRPNELNLVWVDMEMTGLDPDNDRIIEVAVVVTDAHLNVLAEGPVFAIHQSDATLDAMDSWNKGTHGRSGLIDRVKASTVTEADAEVALIAFLKNFVPAGKSPMCGNTICQDRWKPELASGFKKHQKHTALADIVESVEELRYYREHFIKL
jgi:oligoribonuclease